ncbi:MAG: Arc family DNA-binding protein [Polyangiaceae bacterium]|nr:Arc family DNA-binding protein [Polyangiaceae bacterium]MCL4749412.1 Arc family DNA-binding protein [Myxococcales bacterium]
MSKTLTLRNVPEDVVKELRRRAKRNGRSVQSELLTLVRQGTIDQRSLEERLAELRRSLPRRMRIAEIHTAIREGRP